jgi:hypothetical protein
MRHKRRRQYESVVHFLIGVLYQIQARRMRPATTSHYRLSVSAVERSLQSGLEHFRAYELHADSTAEQARRTASDIEKRLLFEKAIARYDEARRRLQDSNMPAEQLRVEELRIKASRSTVLCLLAEHFGDAEPALRDSAVSALIELAAVRVSHLSDGTLDYNLACAWAIASRARLPLPHAESLARYFLVHSWIRSDKEQGWWVEMQLEPDLEQQLSGAVAAHTRLLRLLPEDADDNRPTTEEAHKTAASIVAGWKRSDGIPKRLTRLIRYIRYTAVRLLLHRLGASTATGGGVPDWLSSKHGLTRGGFW